jgi:uncharacterized protein YegJ (DUF2314 family)
VRRLRAWTVAAMGVGLAVGLAACHPKEKDNLVFFSHDDAKMNAAIHQAQETLPVFWAKLDKHDPAISGVLIKVGLPNTHQSLEHIWMTVESHSGLAVRGRLANDPIDLPQLHHRDELSVETSKITDWAYTKAGKQYGGFTIRAMLDSATPDERREIEETLAPTPLEPER